MIVVMTVLHVLALAAVLISEKGKMEFRLSFELSEVFVGSVGALDFADGVAQGWFSAEFYIFLVGLAVIRRVDPP